MSDSQTYRSRHDLRLTLFVWITSALLWLFAYGIIASSGPLGERIFGSSIVFIIGSIAPWLWLSTGYWIKEGYLHLSSGPFHKEIKLADIREITYTREKGGLSFAFSRQGLHIEVEGSERFFRISPKDRDAFVEELKNRCGEGLKVVSAEDQK